MRKGEDRPVFPLVLILASMNFAQQTILWSGSLLEACVIFRLLITGSFRRYLLFSSYLLLVLVRSLADFWTLRFHPELYARMYWYVTEPLSAVLGLLVILELYRKVLELFPGAARLARKLIAFVFVLVVSRILAHAIFGEGADRVTVVLALQRDLRIVQTVFVLGLVALVRYYAIPLGRNLRGMIGGYALYIGTTLIDIALRSLFGGSAPSWWSYGHQSGYLLVLGIWGWALWRFAPMPAANDSGLADDYRMTVELTLAQLQRAQNYLVKSVNP